VAKSSTNSSSDRVKVDYIFFNATDSIMELTPGMGISQLCFLEGNTVCNTSYADRDGKYQNQGPHPIPPLKKLNTPSSLKVIK
jgi:deoxycytidine triphosphate deaminase